MENKYYTPSIEEFHVGFEYEMKSTFGDGTVKTLDDYNKAEWQKYIYDSRSFSYVERTMTGWNSKNLPSAIRVKYLDKEDIESLGGIIEAVCVEGGGDGEDIYKIGNCLIKLHCDYGKTVKIWYKYLDNLVFNGIIKNKSELKQVLKMIGVIE